jgi:hypothetical protein
MARKRQGTEESARGNQGLETPWSSSPTKPPRYVLTCHNLETERTYVVNSYACYAIKKILDTIIDDREYHAGGGIIEVGDINIRSYQLGDILAHTYTKAEEAWELPSPYPEQIERFLNGPRMSKSLIAADRNERGELPHVTSKPKVDRTGLISIGQLCEEEGVEPRLARAELRKKKIEKPSAGWCWPADKVDNIRKIIKGAKK